MRTKSYIIVILIALSLFFSNAKAQDFDQAIGVKAGISPGICYKYFTKPEISFEALATFSGGGMQTTILNQYHHPVFTSLTKQLFFYYGYGAQIGYRLWSNDKYLINGEFYRRREFSFGLGVAGNLGFEYHVLKYPIIFCFDYKPYAEINTPLYYRQNLYDFTISIMFTFSK